MKLKSVTTRTKDDKRIKDISDIYALLWYSEIDFTQLKRRVQNVFGSKIDDVVSEFVKNEYVTVSNALGIESEEIIRVITELTK